MHHGGIGRRRFFTFLLFFFSSFIFFEENAIAEHLRGKEREREREKNVLLKNLVVFVLHLFYLHEAIDFDAENLLDGFQVDLVILDVGRLFRELQKIFKRKFLF